MIIVLSGINLFEGGPISVFYDCLDELCGSEIVKRNEVTAFVHKAELFEGYKNKIKIIELPKSRRSYFDRLYYEYFYFYQYSKKRKIDIWISMHDITPRVRARKIYTYCHNTSPFLKRDLAKLKYSIRNVAFSFFYKYLYRINIKSATAVVVQQDWMRKEFMRMYPVKTVIVARPTIAEAYGFLHKSKDNLKPVFIYAAYPRYFKNYEVILEACEILERKGCGGYEVWLTIDGTENRYSNELRKRYNGLKTVKWFGVIPREQLFRKYGEANCLIFPSTMESWGMPISEFKETGKPMILADLPYAHEALGNYDNAVFFPASDADRLGGIMENVISGKNIFSSHKMEEPEPPYAENWYSLLNLIVDSVWE